MRALLAIAVAALAAIAIPGPFVSAHVRPSGVTYTREIAPLLERRCNACHGTGAIEPALDTYDRTRALAKVIRDQVLEGHMPPWPAAAGFAPLRDDPRLTPPEIDALVAWTDGGTPRGDVPAPAVGTAPTSTPHALEWSVPAGRPGSVGSERVSLDRPVEHNTWINGWAYRPSAAGNVYEAIFSVDGRRLGTWVPGQREVLFPAGVAQLIRAGASIVVERRFQKSGGRESPGGTLSLLMGAPGRQPEHRELQCGNTTLDRDAEALAVQPRAASAGDSIEVIAHFPDGAIEPLLAIARYQPTRPIDYRFAASMPLPRRTTLEVRSSSAGCAADVTLTARSKDAPGRQR